MVFVSFLPCFAEGSYFWDFPKIPSEEIITELPPTNETVSSASGNPSLGKTPLQISPVLSCERSHSSTTQSGDSCENSETSIRDHDLLQIPQETLHQSVSPQGSRPLQFTQLPSQPVCTQPSPNQPLSGFGGNANPVPSACLSQSAPIQVGEIPQSQPVNPILVAQPTYSQTPTLQPQNVGPNLGQFQQQPNPVVLNTAQPTQILIPCQNPQSTGQLPYNQQTNPDDGFVSLSKRWSEICRNRPSDVSIVVNTYDPTATAQTQGALIQNNAAINSHDKTLAFLCEIVSKLYSRAIEHESRENVIETIDPEAVEFIESYIRLREQDTSMESDQFTRYQQYFPRAFWAKKNQPES